MAYQVLARKWRPKKFADLVGQEHVVGALRNALAQGRLHHAYLLTGTRGVGKTTIARILAKSLNCEHPNQGEPCGECGQCVQIDTGRHVDVVEIDAASNTGIDNIREVLENAQYAPSMGRYKVYIIDEVHMLSKSAFNAMLKTLEEPPEHVKFILATTDPQKVPVTVLSRCLQFVLRNMTPQQVLSHLQYVLEHEHIAYQGDALNLLSRAANGSMRDALSLLDQAIALGSGQVQEATVRQMLGAVDRQFVYALLEVLAQGNAQALMQQVQAILSEGAGFAQVLQEMALVLQQVAMVQLLPSSVNELQDAVALQYLAQQMSPEQVQLFYQCTIHGKKDLPLAPDEQAGVMMTMLRMLALRPLGMNDVKTTQQVVVPNQTAVQIEAAVPEVVAEVEPVAFATPATHVHAVSVVEAKAPSPETATMPTSLQAALEPDMDEVNSMLSDSHEDRPWEDMSWHETQIESVQAADTPPWEDERPVKKSETVEMVEVVATTPVLALNADNWPHIVQHIAPQLSVARMLAQHAAFIGFDDSSAQLQLQIAQGGKLIEERPYIAKLAEVLSAYCGRAIHVVLQDWQDTAETPHAMALRQEQEAIAQGLAILAQDATAQQLSTLFEGNWLPESVHLKSSSH
ncbi:subunits gamma and tau of DNA polymerase 3 [Vitreoscilla sp. C1]|uniref:DNA polymerase III subunit gamma/tau n=1 Tax=Vitreoscilla sp. (strain C1) TaxID=96942 RepID=UPI00148EB7CD|nr:DNA polymerase III subunit gamma/tau [Vitreoscilla sp. C1]QJQ52181.1 subunits gamma and tau of DNA polymerase 3 [Vitreoscilla sp. C1]